MELWVADGERGLKRIRDGVCRRVDAPGEALCGHGETVFCAGQCRCGAYDAKTGEKRWEAPVPGGVCALAALEKSVCALSQDTDSVTALSLQSGDTLISAPAGVFPRDLCADPTGKLLAVAGGAAGEILLLNGDLRPVHVYRLPGTVCGVCFLPRCLMELCAVEDGDLSAALFRVSFRGVTEEIWKTPLVPLCLCAVPENGCAVGCHGLVARVRGKGEAPLHWPVPCPARVRHGKAGLLVCDPWEGRVTLLNGKTLYRGGAPQDAIVL